MRDDHCPTCDELAAIDGPGTTYWHADGKRVGRLVDLRDVHVTAEDLRELHRRSREARGA